MSEILLDIEAGVLTITINRPERRNAINEEVCGGIEDAIRAANRDSDARVIVLTGAGDKAFCAGGDLKPGADGTPFTIDPSDPNHYVIKLFKEMERCKIPIVARVNGHALAGGLGLVCACDMAIGVRGAKFGTPESGIGLFPMMILAYMQRVIPRRKLFELCVTGEAFSADDCLEMGILNYVVESNELDDKMEWFTGRIVNKSPTAVKLGKQAFHAIEDMTLDKAFEYTQLMLPMMAMTEDAKEGFAAFNEKRSPDWPGR
ncbi:MAG: enoyl-CoA hydratase-related protein [Pseudomonadota bacterium]